MAVLPVFSILTGYSACLSEAANDTPGPLTRHCSLLYKSWPSFWRALLYLFIIQYLGYFSYSSSDFAPLPCLYTLILYFYHINLNSVSFYSLPMSNILIAIDHRILVPTLYGWCFIQANRCPASWNCSVVVDCTLWGDLSCVNTISLCLVMSWDMIFAETIFIQENILVTRLRNIFFTLFS